MSCYLAFEDTLLAAGLITLWGPRTASYYLPCSTPRARSAQAGTLLIDLALKEARKRGLRYWNWESSPSIDSGVYRFKSKWGSIGSDYRTYVRAFTSVETLHAVGAFGLSENYPHFFIYPFDRL